jgi:hypothetical protein
MAIRVSKAVTILDVMVLVAASALGFGLIRYESGIGYMTHTRYWWHWTDYLGAAIVPLTTVLAVIGLLRCWRSSPRIPPGPGILCCAAVTSLWVTNILRESQTLWTLVRSMTGTPADDFFIHLYERTFLNTVIVPEEPAAVVVATSIVLTLAGRWTFRRDWAEVLGLVIAAIWVIIGLPGTIIRHWN